MIAPLGLDCEVDISARNEARPEADDERGEPALILWLGAFSHSRIHQRGPGLDCEGGR